MNSSNLMAIYIATYAATYAAIVGADEASLNSGEITELADDHPASRHYGADQAARGAVLALRRALRDGVLEAQL